MQIKQREALNRGNNLLIVGLLAFLASGIFLEIFVENELLDKADDIFVTLCALVAVAWYLRGRNRYQRSWLPYVILALTFVAKVLAFINERDDPAAVGDEFGVIIPIAVMLVVSAVILYRTRDQAALVDATPEREMEPADAARPSRLR